MTAWQHLTICTMLMTTLYFVLAYRHHTSTEDGQWAVKTDAGLGFNSLSAAGKAITGAACNGWAFWSLDGELKPARVPKPKAEKPKAVAKPKAERKPRASKAKPTSAAAEPGEPGETTREPAEDAA